MPEDPVFDGNHVVRAEERFQPPTLTRDQVVKYLSGLTAAELRELWVILEDKWGLNLTPIPCTFFGAAFNGLNPPFDQP